MELVFNLDEDELGIYDTERPGSYKSFSGAFFSGAYARPLFVDTREHVMGVHFKPGGAFRFLGVPASELADIHVDLEALWGKTYAGFARTTLRGCGSSQALPRFGKGPCRSFEKHVGRTSSSSSGPGHLWTRCGRSEDSRPCRPSRAEPAAFYQGILQAGRRHTEAIRPCATFSTRR